MDLSTVIGLIFTFGMVALGLLGKIADSNQVLFFVDPGSLLIVMGGSLGSALMSMPLRGFFQGCGALAVAFKEQAGDLRQLTESIVRMSETALRDGVLALEPQLAQIDDPFLHRGLRMVIDGADAETVAATLRMELNQTRARHANGKALLALLARYAPAYGVIGTLIGLILMLASAHAEGAAAAMVPGPGSILRGVALALVTSLYGVLLANAIALPLADRLAEKDRDETLQMDAVMEGLSAIQSGDDPKVVEQKLAVFLPPASRA